MSTTLTIPANMLADVREALFCLLGDATQAIDHALVHPDRDLHPEWFADHRWQLGLVFATLDLVGWAAGEDSRDVEIDVRDHGQTLKEALVEYLPLLEDQPPPVWRFNPQGGSPAPSRAPVPRAGRRRFGRRH